MWNETRGGRLTIVLPFAHIVDLAFTPDPMRRQNLTLSFDKNLPLAQATDYDHLFEIRFNE